MANFTVEVAEIAGRVAYHVEAACSVDGEALSDKELEYAQGIKAITSKYKLALHFDNDCKRMIDRLHHWLNVHQALFGPRGS